jgi:hypothetical protein
MARCGSEMAQPYSIKAPSSGVQHRRFNGTACRYERSKRPFIPVAADFLERVVSWDPQYVGLHARFAFRADQIQRRLKTRWYVCTRLERRTQGICQGKPPIWEETGRCFCQAVRQSDTLQELKRPLISIIACVQTSILCRLQQHCDISSLSPNPLFTLRPCVFGSRRCVSMHVVSCETSACKRAYDGG